MNTHTHTNTHTYTHIYIYIYIRVRAYIQVYAIYNQMMENVFDKTIVYFVT